MNCKRFARGRTIALKVNSVALAVTRVTFVLLITLINRIIINYFIRISRVMRIIYSTKYYFIKNEFTFCI